jgi:hypothetical protein
MKRIVLAVALLSLALGGCAHQIVKPIAPDDFKSSYRKTQEVVLVSCTPAKSRRGQEQISVVEATDTGIRFELHGCYGRSGDRFRITY